MKLFLELREEYWDRDLPIIDVEFYLQEDYGEYHFPHSKEEDTPSSYKIKIKKYLRQDQLIDTLKHEMAHHYVFVNNKKLVWNNQIYMHGKLWRQEMRRIGFTGKITKTT